MNNDEQRKAREAIRALFLRQTVAHSKHGVFLYAKGALGTRAFPKGTKWPAMARRLLYELGQAVAKNDPLTIDERIFLAHLLNEISEGFDVLDRLGMTKRKVGHRTRSQITGDVVREVDWRLAENPNKTAAYKAVAGIIGKDKTWQAVRAQYRRGKTLEKQTQVRIEAAERAHKVAKR